MKYAELGSVSTGTLRIEDLLEAFSYELEVLVQDNAEFWCGDAGRECRDAYMRTVWAAREVDSDAAAYSLDEISDALNEFAPSGAYFGAHPGDGADFGFWLIEDAFE